MTAISTGNPPVSAYYSLACALALVRRDDHFHGNGEEVDGRMMNGWYPMFFGIMRSTTGYNSTAWVRGRARKWSSKVF